MIEDLKKAGFDILPFPYVGESSYYEFHPIKKEYLNRKDIENILTEATAMIDSYNEEVIAEKVDTDDAEWNAAKSEFMDLKAQYEKNIGQGEKAFKEGKNNIAKTYIRSAKKKLSEMSESIDKFTQINSKVNNVDDEKKKIAIIVAASVAVSVVCLRVLRNIKTIDSDIHKINDAIDSNNKSIENLKNEPLIDPKYEPYLKKSTVDKYKNNTAEQKKDITDFLTNSNAKLNKTLSDAENAKATKTANLKKSLLGSSLLSVGLLIEEGKKIITKKNVSGKEMLDYSKRAIKKNMEYCDKLLSAIDKSGSITESADEIDNYDILISESESLVSACEAITEKVDTDDAEWNAAKSEFMELKAQYEKNIKQGEHFIELGGFTIAKTFIYTAKKNLSDMSKSINKFTQINNKVNNVDDEKKKITAIVVAVIAASVVCMGVMKSYNKKVDDISKKLEKNSKNISAEDGIRIVAGGTQEDRDRLEKIKQDESKKLLEQRANLGGEYVDALLKKNNAASIVKKFSIGGSISAIALLIKEGHDIIKKKTTSGKEMLDYTKHAIDKNMEYCDKLLSQIDKDGFIKESVEEVDDNKSFYFEADTTELVNKYQDEIDRMNSEYTVLTSDINTELAKAKHDILNEQFDSGRKHCNKLLRMYPKLRNTIYEYSKTLKNACDELEKSGADNIEELKNDLKCRHSFKKLIITHFAIKNKKSVDKRNLSKMKYVEKSFEYTKQDALKSIDESENVCRVLLDYIDQVTKATTESVQQIKEDSAQMLGQMLPQIPLTDVVLKKPMDSEVDDSEHELPQITPIMDTLKKPVKKEDENIYKSILPEKDTEFTKMEVESVVKMYHEDTNDYDLETAYANRTRMKYKLDILYIIFQNDLPSWCRDLKKKQALNERMYRMAYNNATPEQKANFYNYQKAIDQKYAMMYNNAKVNLLNREKHPDDSVEVSPELSSMMRRESTTIEEAANMENEIKPIVSILTGKGYKVKYSNPGHNNFISKHDGKRDGVKYGKLYSDAHILFDGDYDLTAPEGWVFRDVDNGEYLDVKEPSFKKSEGKSVDAARDEWKAKYMSSLKSWAESLPKSGSKSQDIDENGDKEA